MDHIDLLISNTSQVVTCAGPPGPRRGAAMAAVGIVPGGAVAVRGEHIVAVGPGPELRRRFFPAYELDAGGGAVLPGLVDPHTHVVHAGDRASEFELRIGGATYQEIMAAGGGIASTARATRAASLERLVAESRRRLDQMLRLGTTTAEAKSGYGLDLASELRQLEAMAVLDATHPIDLVPTFLGAHAVPAEFGHRAYAYVDAIIEEMLPATTRWHAESHFAPAGIPLFVDVFCERGAFDIAQSRRVLMAARVLGLPVKAHVDEFSELGGLDMALEQGAVSVDHLDVTGPEGIALLAASPAVGVIIPTVPFNLGSSRYANARAMIDAGAAIALTTDINPGSAPCPSLPLAMAIACRYQHLLPSEVLTAATVNAAYAIGLGERVGSLEPGKLADLLILDVPDYRFLAYEFGGNLVKTVIKRGRVV